MKNINDMNIVNFLGKTKHRALILFPQTILLVIGYISLFLNFLYDIPRMPFLALIIIISIGLIIFAVILLQWSDCKRRKLNNF